MGRREVRITPLAERICLVVIIIAVAALYGWLLGEMLTHPPLNWRPR